MPLPAALTAFLATTKGKAVAIAVVVLLGGGVGLGLALSSGGGSTKTASGTTTTSTTKPTTSTTTTTAKPTCPGCVTSPLLGLLVPPDIAARTALVVKIDNLDSGAETARPQAGLTQADVVYEEIVDGGITRFFALFQSTDSDPVGPIRSGRTTDVHLVPQFNHPFFAWSGGNAGVLAALGQAPIIDVGVNRFPSAYYRGGPHPAPHNLLSKTSTLRTLVAGQGPPPPLFAWRFFGEAISPLAKPASSVRLAFAHSPTEYRWNGKDGWDRFQNGTPHIDASGHQVSPANVVVLVTDYVSSAADSRTPEAITTGSGEVFVATDGHVITGRWNRTDPNAPAVLLDPTGNPIKLMPGRTWVELASPGLTSIS